MRGCCDDEGTHYSTQYPAPPSNNLDSPVHWYIPSTSRTFLKKEAEMSLNDLLKKTDGAIVEIIPFVECFSGFVGGLL